MTTIGYHASHEQFSPSNLLQFDAAAELVAPELVDQHVRASADPARHAEWMHAYAELGFERIYVHHVGPGQERFIETFGSRVLPQVRESLAVVA